SNPLANQGSSRSLYRAPRAMAVRLLLLQRSSQLPQCVRPPLLLHLPPRPCETTKTRPARRQLSRFPIPATSKNLAVPAQPESTFPLPHRSDGRSPLADPARHLHPAEARFPKGLR